MFLNPLPPPERPVFLELAKRLIRSDGFLAPEEVVLLQQIRAELGLSRADEIHEDADLDTLLEAISTRRSQVFILLELLGLGYVDGEYHRSESEFVGRVAARFGYDEAGLKPLEDWVLRTMALMEEAADFWTDE